MSFLLRVVGLIAVALLLLFNAERLGTWITSAISWTFDRV